MGDYLVRRRLASTLILILFSFLTDSSRAGELDSTRFRIQDYIPKRFTDFEWKVDGSASTGSETLDTSQNQGGNLYEINSSGLVANSKWRYRYETTQEFFTCTFDVNTSFDHHNTVTLDSVVDTLGLSQTHEHEQTMTYSSLNFPLNGEFRRYAIASAFLAAEGNFVYQYSQQSDRDIESNRRVEPEDSSGWLDITETKAEERKRSIRRRIDFTGEIRLGWGRVYEGRYAATAINIVGELKRRGLLARDPYRAEMLALTRLIHSYREGHGPDKREYRIEALRALLSNLYSAGIIMDESAAVLLCVEDVLDYYANTNRRFGWTVEAGFGGHDIYYNNRDDLTSLRWTTVTRTNPDSTWIADTLDASFTKRIRSQGSKKFSPADHIVARFSYYRPLADRWQFDFVAFTWLYLNMYRPTEYAQNQSGYTYLWTLDKKVLAADANLRYLYDARTTLRAGCIWFDTVRADHYRRSETRPSGGLLTHETNDWKVRSRVLLLAIGVAYRISPPTTLTVDWVYTKRFNSTDRITADSQARFRTYSFSAKITHWLF